MYFCYALKVLEYYFKNGLYFSVLMWNGPLTNTLITPHLSLKADLPVVTLCEVLWKLHNIMIDHSLVGSVLLKLRLNLLSVR